MKKTLQIVLFLFLIFLIFFFYKTQFEEEKKITIKQETIDKINTDNIDNNLIKNLEYEININENNNYNLTSKFSEIVYQDGFETVKMRQVKGIFTSKDSEPIIITSDFATYNNKNYNTTFERNIKIRYIDSIIYGEILILDFEKNNITVSNNVKYDGPNGILYTDNILIDIITKKIDIFMDKSDKKVIINSKK